MYVFRFGIWFVLVLLLCRIIYNAIKMQCITIGISIHRLWSLLFKAIVEVNVLCGCCFCYDPLNMDLHAFYVKCKVVEKFIHSYSLFLLNERTNRTNKRSPSSLLTLRYSTLLLACYMDGIFPQFTLNAGNGPNHIFTTHHCIHINYILY